MNLNFIRKNVFRNLFDKVQNTLFNLFNKKNLTQILKGQGLNDIDGTKEYSEEEMLIHDLKEAKNEWMNAELNFQYVSEDEFIEYYTYRLKAAQIKYEFFLRKAKEKGIKVNIFGNDVAVQDNGINICSKDKNINMKEGISTTLLNSNSAGTGANITSKIEK